MKSVKVSVFLLFCKTERYLSECLEKLMAQSIEEFEIICVDTGLTDDAREILKEYGKNHPEIRLLKCEGDSGKNELNEASGEYVIFLDSSDFAAAEMLKKVYEAGAENDADIVLLGAERQEVGTQKTAEIPVYFQKNVLPAETIFSRKDIPGKILNILLPIPGQKLFKREFLFREKLEIHSFGYAEIMAFDMLAMCTAEKITAVEGTLVYHQIEWRNHPENDPGESVRGFYLAYRELNSRGIFAEVEKSWVDAAISGIAFKLGKISAPSAKLEFCNAVGSEEFLETSVFNHADEFYSSLKEKKIAEGALYALKWHTRMSRIKDGIEAGCVKEKSGLIEAPLVSVIIPVYNVEAYLRECLDSIVNQTLRQIEIICVNDGSTDASQEILMDYAKQDQRISIYVQSNSGQSVARNVGIKHAEGEYLYFMDSDDILETNALELLYGHVKEKDLDVIYFDGVSFGDSEKCAEEVQRYQKYYQREYSYPAISSGEEILRLFVENEEYRVQPCLQLLRRSYLCEQKLFFYEGVYHEDNLFNFCAMLNAGRAGYLHEKFFKRRVREQSTMTSKVTFTHVYGYFICFIEMNRFIEGRRFSDGVRDAVNVLSYRLLHNARNKYMELEEAEKYSFWGIEAAWQNLFVLYVVEAAEAIEKWKEFRRLLRITKEEKEELNRKLQVTYDEKSELNHKLQVTYGEKSELNRKLQIIYDEKSELNRKLQVTYDEKSELNRKLKVAYNEKSKLGQKLQTAYKEKSELNQKLRTASETSKEQEEKIKTLETTRKQLEKKNQTITLQKEEREKELEELKQTAAYKIGKVIVYIPGKIKKWIRRFAKG